jgi:predicted transposase/invertase (TIGR01784 family)
MSFKPARFLDPKSDIVFKKIFGNNPAIVKSFLNGVLPLPDDALIENIEYLTPEQSPRIPTLKNSIVDVKCQDQKGRIFIVEMQMQWSDSFTKRLMFGASKAYIQQLAKGAFYESLCPVYGLGIINAIFDEKSDDWFHHYKIINTQDQNKVLDGMELIFLELPKFKPQTWPERKAGVLWLRFLREIDEKTVDFSADFYDVSEIIQAMEIAQESSFTPGELESYDRYWDAVSVEKSIQFDAEKKGMEQGRAAEKITIANALFETGMDIPAISNITGLSVSFLDETFKTHNHSD